MLIRKAAIRNYYFTCAAILLSISIRRISSSSNSIYKKQQTKEE